MQTHKNKAITSSQSSKAATQGKETVAIIVNKEDAPKIAEAHHHKKIYNSLEDIAYTLIIYPEKQQV